MTQETKTETAIEVTPNGPYIVTGGVPMVRVEPVVTDQGEPVDWRVAGIIDTPDTYRLCRCGQCANTPFSDDDGCSDFDGTETAPTNTYSERAKTLGGTKVTVRDDRGICSHAGFCANRITNVWKAAKTIDDDEALREQVIGMVERCPSGALAYEIAKQAREPALPVQIGVETNGPFRVTGGIPIRRADGQPLEVRHRVSLCRCGQSKNKPLCDGSHKEVGFQG